MVQIANISCWSLTYTRREYFVAVKKGKANCSGEPCAYDDKDNEYEDREYKIQCHKWLSTKIIWQNYSLENINPHECFSMTLKISSSEMQQNDISVLSRLAE